MAKFAQHQLCTYFKDNRYILSLQDKYYISIVESNYTNRLELDYILNTNKNIKVLLCSKTMHKYYEELLLLHNNELMRRGEKPKAIFLRYTHHIKKDGFCPIDEDIECFTEEEEEYLLYNFGYSGFALPNDFTLPIWGDNIAYLKEQFNVENIPNAVKVERLLGETSDKYHVKYLTSQFWLYKKDCNDIFKHKFKDVHIDTDKLNKMCTWDEWQRKGYSLKPHQIDGIKFILNEKKCCIFDTTGIGKSIQAICAAIEAKAKKILIITIANDKNKWGRVCEWYGLSYTVLEGGEKDNRNYVNDSDVTIINYELFPLLLKKSPFLSVPFDFVTVDECHYVKEAATKQAKTVKMICNSRTVKHVVGLTATPIENNENVYNIFKNLSISVPGLIPDNNTHFSTASTMFTTYLRRYCGMWHMQKKDGTIIPVRGGNTNTHELSMAIKGKYIRRTHNDVEGFPKKTVFPIYISLTGEQRKQYDEIIKQVGLEEKYEGKDKKGVRRLIEDSRLRQFMALESITPTMDFIKNKVQDGHRFVIFTHFIEEFDAFKKDVELSGIKSVWVNANKQKTYKKKDNFEIVDMFNNDRTISIIFGNIETLGTAHNIPTANYSVVNSPDWANRNHEQGEGRIWRINSETDAIIIYPVFLDTIVETVFDRAHGKKSNANILFNEK